MKMLNLVIIALLLTLALGLFIQFSLHRRNRPESSMTFVFDDLEREVRQSPNHYPEILYDLPQGFVALGTAYRRIGESSYGFFLGHEICNSRFER